MQGRKVGHGFSAAVANCREKQYKLQCNQVAEPLAADIVDWPEDESIMIFNKRRSLEVMIKTYQNSLTLTDE